MLQVKSIVLGIVGTNCYIVYDKNTKEAVLIDPGAEEDRIIAFLEEEDLKPRAILLTHGHFDHILAVPTLREKYCLPLYASEAERELLGNGELNLSGKDPEDSVEISDFISLHDGEVPYLFSGDTLFCESYGRTDLYSGSEKEIIKSIVKKLFVLPEETLVFPGHEESTTIRNEKSYNPVNFFKE